MKLQKRWSWIATVAVLGIGLYAGVNSLYTRAEANTTSPGSVDDPVVTKSYVDQQIRDMVKQELAAQSGGAVQPTASPTAPAATTPPSTSTGSDSGAATITVVTLKAGQTLYAGAGSEFLVRTGKTVAVSTDSNGIPDVTAGKDVAAGTAIELNHLLLFPREGRGIKPDPKNKADIFVMVRGPYLLMNADGTKVTP